MTPQLFIFSIISFFAIVTTTFSQVRVEIRELRPNFITIDTADYPVLRALLRTSANGTPYTFSSSELTIIESNLSTKATSVSAPDAQGYQEVTWITRSEGGNRAEFVVSTNAGTGSTLGRHDRDGISQVRFCDPFSVQIEEFNFGSVAEGYQEYTTLLVKAIGSKKNSRGIEVSTNLDSITFSHPDFSYRWIGSYVSTNPPPVGLSPAVGYYFDIIFKPSRSGYYKEYAVLHYEGGQKDYLLLRANGFEMKETRSLQLVAPDTSIILTPCTPYQVKWKGYRVGAPTYVDWTPDNGKTWDTLGFSMDSVLLWITPGTITDSGRLRIRQELGNFDQKTLLHPALKAPVSKISWNAIGDALIAGYESGKIAEWSKVDGTLRDTFLIPGIAFPVSRSEWLGIGYLSDSSIYGVYRIPSTGQELLSVFNRGSLNPILLKTITGEGEISAVHRIKDELFVIPKRGKTLRRISLKDGSESTPYSFPEPITAFNPGNGITGSIALLDGSIHVLDMSTVQMIAKISNPALPLISQLAVSNDGAYLAAGTMLSEQSLYSVSASEVHVIDIATKTIVRSLRNSASDVIALDFNSTNQFLATGFAGFPQISVWRIPTNVFLGQLANHEGFLTDIKYSPDGKSLASSARTSDNLKVMDFAFPEKDTSIGFIRIEPSKPVIVSADLGDAIMMHPTDSILTVNLCNGGNGDIFIDYAYFRDATHFSLISQIPNTLRIAPGKCIDISIRVLARDNGLLTDSLFFGFCNQEFFMPIRANGVLRSITPIAQGQKLGPACINETVVKTIELIRNDDPVPVTINRISTKSPAIKILTKITDSILKPGASLFVEVQFSPKQLGEEIIEVLVFHSGLTQYEIPIVLKGYGDGTDISVPGIIACIPELKKKTITLQNASMNEVRLDSVFITGNAFQLTTSLPLIFPPKSQRDIEITFTGSLPDSGEIIACSFYPCASAKVIRIVPYSATATVRLPQVKADPRGKVSLPMSINLTEKYPYIGSQEAFLEFRSKAGLFLPDSISSAFGAVQILSRDIIGDERITKIRFDGTIPKSGIFCTVSGFVGIGDLHTTQFVFNDTQVFFSRSVSVNYVPGSLELINICADLFLQKSGGLTITSIYPQPANDNVSLNIQSKETMDISIVFADQMGKELAIMKYPIFAGEQSLNMQLPHELQSGVYIVKVSSDTKGLLTTKLIHVIR
jgi:WD40 repeat protein